MFVGIELHGDLGNGESGVKRRVLERRREEGGRGKESEVLNLSNIVRNQNESEC